MKHDVLQQADKYAKARRRKRRWYRVVTCLACVVVFCTTYALILPAITMEDEFACGLEEHTHTEACYTQVTSVTRTKPMCTIESSNLHEHTEDCYGADGELICGYADFVVHEHDSSCYDEDGKLWCPLPEIEPHIHDESCFAVPETVHTHTDECYTMERGELICTEEELSGHTHRDDCFDENDDLICQIEESTGHQHTDDCYAWERVLTCELSTEPADESEAAEPELICGQEEIILHEHTADCFDESGNLICGQIQVLEHVHSEDCFQTVEEAADTEALTCTLPEDENHTHTALCYGTWELTCGLQEHTHSEACLPTSELTGEEQARVDEVIALIDALPTSEEIDSALTAYDEAGDEEGYEAYFMEVSQQARTAYAQYEDLGPELQELVSNRDKLLELEWLLPAEAQEETFSLSAQTETGIEVTVSGPVESLPYAVDEITLTAEEIVSDTAETIRDQALEEEGLTAEKNYLFDVTLWYDGQQVEPLGPVTLTFSGLPLVGMDECKVYHIDEEAEQATDMNALLDEKDNVVLDTEHFSVYGVSLFTAATGSYTMTASHTATETMYADSDVSEYLLLALEDGKYYALGGDGNTYEVKIANDTTVQYSGTVDQIKNLCWTMSEKETESGQEPHRKMYIRNVKTGSYLYPNGSSLLTSTATKVNLWLQDDSDYAATIYPTEEWPKIAFGSSHTFHTYLDNQESEAWFFFAKVSELPYCHVWLDGTDGGIMSLGGAGNTCQELEKDTTFTLPDTITAPDKYSYQLKGWYDINTATYYQPGDTVTITQDTVFYADWEPVTYDIGQGNENTVSSLNTNAFITTHVFDYGALFNVQSSNAATSINSAEHTETWSLVDSSAYSKSSLGFVFRDWDTSNKSISYPVGSETWTGGVKQPNPNDNNPDIYSGLYQSALIDLLFNPSKNVIGKTYVGTGNYLYQYNDATGYYYYDSKLNAASYNQSNSRFYIYNYLERTSDSPKDSETAERGRYSDFLPFNSPYVNTNGKTVQTYGADSEKKNYQYDAKYDSTEGGVTCSPSNAGTNYWFGMSSTIRFYLPDNSASGGTGKLNQSTKGKDMIFKFSGDDDVWVLVDGNLVLDIGGLHGIEEGSINFSTGEVWRSTGTGDGEATTHSFSAGEHTLTIYYLERGGSQSNCAIYFNIAPRDYTLELTKTDRDTPDKKLPGAEFTVYRNQACTTVAANLKDANGNVVTNGTFVSDEKGQIHCYGLLPNNTYYIKETKAPPGYNGNENVIIELSIAGIEDSYQITSQLYVDGQPVSIDDTTNNIYLTADLSTAGQDRTMKYVFSNQVGYMLPNTGGAGTTMYTIGGLLLIAGASFLLLYNHTKRRKEDHASS